MCRDWTLPLVIGLALMAAPLLAAEEKKGEHNEHKDHGPAIYEAAFHDVDGKHVVQNFSTASPAEKAKLIELIEHGHVAHLTNKTAPDLAKIFSAKSELGIWTLIIFGLLFFILGKFAWPKMVAGLQRREQNIRGALDDAEKARNEAKALMAENEKQRIAMGEQVKEIIAEAKKDAQIAAELERAKAREEITTERERLRREIQIETDQAMQKLWNKAATLATTASGMAIRKQLDGEQHRKLIDEALDDLRKTTA